MNRALPEETELLKRLLAGDEAAFTGLVESYHGRLLRLAQMFVHDRASAEEVVQETWMAVLDGLRGFEGRSSLKSWIFRILTNRAKTRGVREGRSLPFSSLDPGSGPEPAVDPSRFGPGGGWSEPPLPWSDETGETLVLRGEAMAVLQEAIATLPESQRAVLTLRDVDGLSSEEVCNALEISETNQRVLLHRARSKLRRALEERLGRE